MSIPQIEAGDLMHTTLRATPFSAEGWLFEIKYDGFRCLTRKEGSRVDLVSKQGKPLNPSFPDIVAAVESVPGDFVWDAELTVDDSKGRPSFERLQTRARTSVPMKVRAAARDNPARLYVFDVLASDGLDLRVLPLAERKDMLRDSFDDTGTLIFVRGVVSAGVWVFQQVRAHDLEGMVAKRLASIYQRGKSRDWLKSKYSDYGRPAALGFGHSRTKAFS
ncbi:DNA ligase [Paraburkholderia hospita]|uniref:ATP-dependent DNA ligase n=1 Tax=Paraburkholderia hospita TaxID=169430 RepID=UPI001F259D8F|nr:DNA ligase [Paraburkholderia hospita]